MNRIFIVGFWVDRKPKWEGHTLPTLPTPTSPYQQLCKCVRLSRWGTSTEVSAPPRAGVCSGIYSWCVAHSVGLNKQIPTSLHHPGVPTIMSLPRISYALIYSTPWAECCLPGVSWSWRHSMQAFQTGFDHLLMCILVSSVCFHGLLAHFLSLLSNVPWLAEFICSFTYWRAS